MPEPIRILNVERDSDEGLIVTYSDGTSAGYLAEELLDLRPHREPVQLVDPNAPTNKTSPYSRITT
jgi:hypothetical protein